MVDAAAIKANPKDADNPQGSNSPETVQAAATTNKLLDPSNDNNPDAKDSNHQIPGNQEKLPGQIKPGLQSRSTSDPALKANAEAQAEQTINDYKNLLKDPGKAGLNTITRALLTWLRKSNVKLTAAIIYLA